LDFLFRSKLSAAAMAILLGFGSRIEPEGSGEFFCKACDRASSFIYLRVRTLFYFAFLPIFAWGAGRRVVQCRGCTKQFPENIFKEGSPLIFLTSVLEPDGSVTYGIRSRETELPVDSEWALGCWYDGLWYPVVLSRTQGNRRLALFADRGCCWLDPDCIAPMDLRPGDAVLVAESPTDIDAGPDDWLYHPARLLTWEPDYRNTVVEYRNGTRDVVTRWVICVQRPKRIHWKPGDRVLAYRNEGAYFPGTISQVRPHVEVRFDDGSVSVIRFRLIEPLDLPENAAVWVRNDNGAEYANGTIVSWDDRAVAVRLETGETEVFSLDRIAVPAEMFAPSDSDLRTFFESKDGPINGADWSTNSIKLGQAIQYAGNRSSRQKSEETRFTS
jgi:hypothetical protein